MIETEDLFDRGLATFAESLPAIAWRATADGRVDFVNRAWRDYTGLTGEESVGDGWLIAIHPDDAEPTAEAWAQAVAAGSDFAARFRLRRADAAYHWYAARGAPVRDASDAGARWLVTAAEIEDRARAEDEFRAIAEAIPQMVWRTRADGRIDYLNGQVVAYAGTFDVDPARWTWFRIVHRADRLALLNAWRAAITTGDPVEQEVRLRRADGAWRWFVVRASAVRDSDATVTAWFGTCTDVHAIRRRAERDAFLAGADALFAAELDPDAILRIVAAHAVQAFSDYCVFDRLDDDALLRRAAVQHRDPSRALPLLGSLGEVVPADHPLDPVTAAWRGGESVVVPHADPQWWRRAARDDRHYERMRDAGLSSLITVPIASRGRRYGVLTFCRSAASADYDDDDVTTAEELGRRVGAALENARLYREARAAVETQRRIAQREAFYARLAESTGETLDLRETLDAAMMLLVPGYADATIVNLVQNDGELALGAARHRDPELDTRLRALVGQRYLRPDAAAGSPLVKRIGRGHRYENFVPDEWPVAERYRRLLEAVGPVSAIVVPLATRGVIRGTIVALYDRSSQRRYREDDLAFFEEVARRIAPSIVNAEAYERERRVARTFQAAALTTDLPRLDGTAFDALYEAGRSEALIGGDWYDAFRVADGRVVVSIGDVAGSGLDAAATMAAIRQSLRGVAAINPDPSVMLDAADRVLRAQTPSSYVTAWVGVIDPVWSTLACAGAGHPPPLVRRDGVVTELPAGGLPLGLRDRGKDVTRHLALAAGSAILLFTDGLVEATRDLIAGEAAVRRAFAAVDLDAAPAQAIHEAVLGADGASDDVAILVVAYRRALGAAPDDRGAYRWRFDARDAQRAAGARTEIAARLARRGFADTDVVLAELVYAELVGNAARHAAGEIDVALDASGEAAVLHVVDAGPGFAHNARLPADGLAEGGRGLYIVATIAEEFSVTRRAAGGSHARAVLTGRLH